MIPDCDGRTVRRSDGRTESIIAKTALCIASYADALSKTSNSRIHNIPKEVWPFYPITSRLSYSVAATG